MRNEEKQRQSGCPLAFGLDSFGDRWSLLVIREIMFSGKSTYGEFLEMEEGISTNILADRLKHLEVEGILEKQKDPENRRSYRYSLTEKGRDLAAVMIEIIAWSGRHDSRPHALREMVERIDRDRKAVERMARGVA